MYMKVHEVTFGMRLYLGVCLFTGKYSIIKDMDPFYGCELQNSNPFSETVIYTFYRLAS